MKSNRFGFSPRGLASLVVGNRPSMGEMTAVRWSDQVVVAYPMAG